jgi:hypothetical protein
MVSGRVQAADAAFTIGETTPFTLRLGYDPATGEYVDDPLEIKTFGPRPGARQFHDSVGYYPGLWCCDPEGYLVFWDFDTSAVVPATSDYTTKITWPDNSPAYDLYGTDLDITVLGSGNPGDDEVQYGLHLGVARQAEDGSWAHIVVWNAPALLELEMYVDQVVWGSAQFLKYRMRVTNLSPGTQYFVLDDPIPEHTTYMGGRYYDADTNSIHVESRVGPRRARHFHFWVKVDEDTPSGTLITNQAVLTDDAVGDSASVTTEVQ